jgi:copper chaperone CopZ
MTIQFKSNLKCDGCVAAVRPFLEAVEELLDWEVDLKSKDRLVTFYLTDDAAIPKLQAAFQKAGFKLEKS